MNKFVKRVLRSLAIAFAMILIALLGGMWGYRYFEQMGWDDAYVNAAMILSGMGPLGELKTEAGKIFAGTYALFSGIIFLVIMAIILSPAIHRAVHCFHIEDENTSKKA